LCYDILRMGNANAKAGFWWIQLKSDVLSLHIPWTAQTNKMVDAAFIYGFEKVLDFEYLAR
jgi:D-3-phosphoglycerate dehydrogenase